MRDMERFSHRVDCWANMASMNDLKYISYRTHNNSFHFLLFFLLILFLAWFALSPSITSPNQCSRSGWKNGQPQSHIHLNHFNANIDRRSIDTGWAAFFFFNGCAFFLGLCYPWYNRSPEISIPPSFYAQKCVSKSKSWSTFNAKLVSLQSRVFR